MKELITEITETSISTTPPPYSTDEIVSKYENKINASIAARVLRATKDGIPPVFTKEELAYLSKKASEDGPFAEVTVITPDPTITLKNGNTEINIKRAATLVKKMEEMYPTSVTNQTESIIINKEPIEKNNSQSDEFKHRVNFPTKNISSEVAKCVAPDIETFQSTFVAPVAPPVEKTINKNAYEIRESILEKSIDVIKFSKIDGDLEFIVDKILKVASKFYEFVENKNRNKY